MKNDGSGIRHHPGLPLIRRALRAGERMIARAALLLLAAQMFAPPALAGGCDPVLAAQIKGLDTPSRSTTKFAINGGGISTLLSIAVGGKVWSKTRDTSWKAAPQPLDKESIAKYWAGETCTPGETETIDGDATDIVEHHTTAMPPMDMRFWISKSSGLIVKTVVHAPGSVITTQTEYDDVQVPVGDSGGAAK
jgi:hypothetical protein